MIRSSRDEYVKMGKECKKEDKKKSTSQNYKNRRTVNNSHQIISSAPICVE